MAAPSAGPSGVAPPERPRGLIDRRLLRRVAVTRRYLAVAVAVGAASTVCLIAQAVLVATVVDRVFLHRSTLAEVTPLLVGLAGTCLFRAVLAWAGEVAAHRTSATVTSTLRRQMLSHALELGPSWLSGEQTGELSVAATRGVGALDAYFARVVPQTILAALAPTAVLAWVAWSDWLSFAILAVTLAALPVFMILLGLAAKDSTHQQWERLSHLGARFLDILQGLPTLRSTGSVSSGRRSIEAATDDLRQATMSTLRVAFLSSLALEMLAAVGTALVALFLGLRLLDGEIAFGTALAILMLAPEVYLPLRRAATEFHASTEGQAAAARILDILDQTSPVGDTSPVGVDRTPVPGPDPGRHPLVLQGITVGYPGRSGPVLDDVDLTVSPGEHVALMGPSGSGKSTLLGVVLGFVTPLAGTVSIGGVELSRADPRQWRRQIAWVPQRPSLFRGSLADNITVGDRTAGPSAVARAVEVAGLDELVAMLPDGLDTEVGEGGFTLSAGERQRVAIARAVLRDAPLVLLDEPSSHLDRGREAALSASLGPFLEGRTVLIAAHRRGLVGRVDRVVTLAGVERPRPPVPVALTGARR